jgi:transposase
MKTSRTSTSDQRAQQRSVLLSHVLAGELTVEDAASFLHLSVRQVGRLLDAFRALGSAGLVHGNAGRSPAHRMPDELRDRLVELATTTYAGANRTHLSELLAEREGITVPERTLRRVLAEAGLAPVHRRRPARHRSRRERMPRAGMLLQVDGSREDWLLGRGPWLTLVGGIDDATSEVTGATFRAQEDAAGYLETFCATAHRHGLPDACYSDRHGIFWRDRRRPPTLTEQLTGRRSLTQVGDALREAGIAWIGAHSPQAKGRVERLWGTLQDRLVVELRLAGADDLVSANRVLDVYLPRHNARFAVPAADPSPAWRALPEGRTAEDLFCFRYPRRVAPDATIAWAGGALALPRRPDGRSWAGRAVILQERIDGSLWVEHGNERHPLRSAPDGPPQLRARQLSRTAQGAPDLRLMPAGGEEAAPGPVPPPRSRRPGPDHPWRR